ncbi:hypothetical protein RJ639_020697 [Escallonia herrerae]|uniref:Uncharacterized protein n=1 Tax=Escallonia herrerae TaxID=1293975 RepID=A0AA89AEQ0_9ASTE|nr:hypothetical protein RJ639_020697 [Escallonia herrerae]
MSSVGPTRDTSSRSMNIIRGSFIGHGSHSHRTLPRGLNADQKHITRGLSDINAEQEMKCRRCGEGELSMKEMAEKLMRDTAKDDESVLPHFYPLEWEHQLSSIFVDAETPLGRYGTRSTSALCVKANGELKKWPLVRDRDLEPFAPLGSMLF